MTSRADAVGHPDVDEISDLIEGLLSPSRATDVQQHLDGCDVCSDVREALSEIREMLGTLPGPSRMPDDVTERINAALAAEALLSRTGSTIAAEAEEGKPFPLGAQKAPAGDISTSPEDHRDTGKSQEPGDHVSRETSAIGAGSVAVDRPEGHPRAATGPGRSRRPRSGRHRKSITLGAVFTAAAIGLGTLLVQTMNSGTSGNAGDTTATRTSDSRLTFSSSALEGQVSTLLNKAAPRPESTSDTSHPTLDVLPDTGDPKKSPESNTPLSEPGTAVRLPDCIKQGIGAKPGTDSGATPLAAEQGVFEGTDAYLVVFPDPSDGTRVSAYVVDSACTQQAKPSPGTVLLVRSYPRS